MLPYDDAPDAARAGFGHARHRAYLANLAAKKNLEKEMRERAEVQSGRAEREARERGFQNYWQGANNIGLANGTHRRQLRNRALASTPSEPSAPPVMHEVRPTRRKWEIGTPVLLKITDGEYKGEVLQSDQRRHAPLALARPTVNAATATERGSGVWQCEFRHEEDKLG